jgi:hypothetical protein
MSKRFKSSQDANSALEKSIGSTTDYSWSKELATDILRFKIVKRTPTNSGSELLILDSMPRYPKAEEAYWVFQSTPR